ncbi:MAG: hypothetical protein ACM3MH_11010 [Actinomycetota bacterium]
MAGFDVYELSFKATVQFPDGANKDCQASQNFTFSNFWGQTQCSAMQRQFVPPGGELNFSQALHFRKTEKGWEGEDGSFY